MYFYYAYEVDDYAEKQHFFQAVLARDYGVESLGAI